jgi:hypothetical protein
MHNVSGDADIGIVGCGLTGRRVCGRVLVLEVEIGECVARISVEREKRLVVDRTRMSMAEVFEFVLNTEIHSWTKHHLFHMIVNSDNCARSLALDHAIPVEVKEVLHSELCGFGCYHFTKELGKEVIVGWNNNGNEEVTYVCEFSDPEAPERSHRSGGGVRAGGRAQEENVQARDQSGLDFDIRTDIQIIV